MAGKDAPPVRATPYGDGYAMPGRFERHARTLLTWPPIEEEVGTDVARFRDEVEATARAISRFEPVTLIVDSRDEDDARSRLGGEVEILVAPVDNCWLRDNGPIFVRNDAGDVAGVHFGFNGRRKRCRVWSSSISDFTATRHPSSAKAAAFRWTGREH